MAEPNDNKREGGEEEEEEEEIDEAGYKTIKDAVLFAIDVSSSMLSAAPQPDSKSGGQLSPTSAALKCAYALMQQRIISNPNDMMGILLFGTKETKFREGEEAGPNFPHCYLLTDLDIPAAADVKRLKSLVEEDEESSKLLVPSTEQVAMANVLFCANQIFATKAPNFSSRRLFLVTDNDEPHADSKELRSSAIVRAKDLYDLGVFIELFPISRPDHEFDRGKFYDDIVYRLQPSDPEAPSPIATTAKTVSAVDGLTLLQSLLNEINSKNAPRRALFSNIPLEFDASFKISVRGYVIFKRQEAARSCYIWLDGETPQIAIGTTARLSDDNARAVKQEEIRKAFKFGGDSVLFTPEELSSMRNFGDPVIRILGFKPISMLPLWANLRPATFIYPSEEEFVGSTRTFSALQQTLLQKQKMAIVWYIARRNAAPVIAALMPGPGKVGEHGEQLMPAGLWIVPIPFRDDIRDNPEVNSSATSPDSLVDRMRDVIQQLQLPKAIYDPSKYPNPALQWHYKILQAMALEEDLPEVPEDKTIPRYRQIHKRAGPYVIAWGEELDKQYRAWQKENAGQAAAPVKRPAKEQAGESSNKKLKAIDDGISDEKMREHVNKGSLSKLTVNDLKEWAKRKNISVGSMKKAELVETIEQHFETKMQLD